MRPERAPRIKEAGSVVGAEKLLAHIRGLGLSIPDFCERHGLFRQKVEKAIKGDLKRVDVDFALAIERATGAVVTVPDWETPVTEGDSEHGGAAPAAE
jgi:hypothetical protein